MVLYSGLLRRSDEVATLAERGCNGGLGEMGVQRAVLSTAMLQKLLLSPTVEWACI
jgi:hypothetical protein